MPGTRNQLDWMPASLRATCLDAVIEPPAVRSSHRFRRPGLPEIEHGRKYEIELSIFTPDVLAAAPRS